ncbi:hypothetical protein ABVN80_14780 [Acinetobacter baumannii]
MKVTAHRIARSGYDAVIIGFDRPCIISLYLHNVSPLCGPSHKNDEGVFRYSFHSKEDADNKNLSAKNYTYVDGLTIKDFYEYFSTMDLSHLNHEQHKALYAAVAEINDITDYCAHVIDLIDEEDDEEIQHYRSELKRTDSMIVDLENCVIEFSDGSKATYDDLHN